MPASYLDRWTPDNAGSNQPRVTINDPNGNYNQPSDFYVEDAGYLRLKTLQLGYSLPDFIIERAKLSKARFYVSVDNLFTLTEYSGLDPEIGAYGGNLNIGIDRGFYPQARTFRVGANISF